MSSQAVSVTTMYSVSIEDLATVFCFLEVQEIGLKPI